jgi:hypothetical protein
MVPDGDVLLRNCDECSGHRQGQIDLLPMTYRTASRWIPRSVEIVPEAGLEHVGGAVISSFSYGSPVFSWARRWGSPALVVCNRRRMRPDQRGSWRTREGEWWGPIKILLKELGICPKIKPTYPKLAQVNRQDYVVTEELLTLWTNFFSPSGSMNQRTKANRIALNQNRSP